MNNDNKQILVITKKQLNKKVAKETGYNVHDVKEIYEAFEDVIKEYMLQTNSKESIEIKLSEGISLMVTYHPEKTKTNNLTGETIVVPAKIKPKFNITKNFGNKLNKLYSDKNI